MTPAESRRDACRRLTRLLREHRPFSFLRLGDGELSFMLNVQRGMTNQVPHFPASCEIAYDGPGIDDRHYDRLRRSYEECTYLDFHDSIPFNACYLAELNLQRSAKLFRNGSPETSLLVYDWTYHEFRDFIRGRRCLFAGAEAALLRELHADREYRALAAPFWPVDADPVFHQVRGNGANLSENLDLIKSDLAKLIRDHQIDTLFLCLGGAAKIICHELAQELTIRALDWGSMMRGLAYCGSAGAALWRASHNPFFVRIPFAMHMRALLQAHPDMPPVTVLAKAHAQLCLDLQRKEPMTSFAADPIDPSSFDPSPENLHRFFQGRRYYQEHFVPLARRDPEAMSLVREFHYWCLKKGLGWKGKLFQLVVRGRKSIRSLKRSAPSHTLLK